MGLLDSITEFVKTPEGQGLLSAAFSGAAASRGNNPWNTAGAAGLGGLHGYNNAINQGVQRQESEQQAQYRAAQMKKMQAEQERQARQDEATQRALAGLPPEQRAAVDMGVPMADIWKRNNPEAKYQPMGNQLLKIQGSDVMPVFEGQKKAPEGFEYIDGKLTPIQAYWDQKRSVAQNGRAPTPYFTPVPTVNGLGRFDSRTGNFELVDGGGIVKPSDSPPLQAAIIGAKKGAELSATAESDAKKAVKKSDQFLATAKQAEGLLKQGPTASGVGAAVDSIGNFVGASSKSNETATQLEAISGWLVSNVPRMEGPQSNFDVQNYQTMSGVVGDRTKPIKVRQAALQTVIQLQEKYKHLNQDSGGEAPVQSAQPSGAVRKFNPKTGRIE